MDVKTEDTYLTVENPSPEILFKEKNSKFYGYVFPIKDEDDAKATLEILRKKHPTAGHYCYAYQLGTSDRLFRVNDDGEPSSTAGKPIYGQIQSFGVTNVLIVIVRYFGGTKLGVGGLISAYRTAAQLALEQAHIIEKTEDINFILTFGYPHMNKVMRLIKQQQVTIVAQQLLTECEMEVKTRKKNAASFETSFSNLPEVRIRQKK